MVVGTYCSIKTLDDKRVGKLRLTPSLVTELYFEFSESGYNSQDNLDLPSTTTLEQEEWIELDLSVDFNLPPDSDLATRWRVEKVQYFSDLLTKKSDDLRKQLEQCIKEKILNISELQSGSLAISVLSPGSEDWVSGFMRLSCRTKIDLDYTFFESPKDFMDFFKSSEPTSPLDEIRHMLD